MQQVLLGVLDQRAARRVDHALGLARRPRRVHDEHGVVEAQLLEAQRRVAFNSGFEEGLPARCARNPANIVCFL